MGKVRHSLGCRNVNNEHILNWFPRETRVEVTSTVLVGGSDINNPNGYGGTFVRHCDPLKTKVTVTNLTMNQSRQSLVVYVGSVPTVPRPFVAVEIVGRE